MKTYILRFEEEGESHYGAVAGQIEIFGKLSVLLMGIPVLVAVVENINALAGHVG